VVIGVGALAVASAPRLPAQPASPAIYMSEADLMATLGVAAKSAPAMHTAPIKTADHYRITVVRRTTCRARSRILTARRGITSSTAAARS